MKKVAIFASGSGTNAQNIIEYFKDNKKIKVQIILSNNKDAYVIERAKKFNIPHLVFDKHKFYETNIIENFLLVAKTDFVILAGFLWLIPEKFINTFENKIINIHPALLPKYGGKGMYGAKIHEEVLKNKDKETPLHYSIKYWFGNHNISKLLIKSSCFINM
jgi:phosphoribosylglycinamide formyltransferase-1